MLRLRLQLKRLIWACIVFVAVRPRITLTYHPRAYVVALSRELRQQTAIAVTRAGAHLHHLALQCGMQSSA